MKKIYGTTLIIGLSLSGVCFAKTTPIYEGMFKADHTCPAYNSYKKKTNPGNVQLIVGEEYKVTEEMKTDKEIAYRIKHSGWKPKERWVSSTCGTTKNLKKQKECTTVADSANINVLALSWQPAFCETKQTKECENTNPSQYHANNFVLHGYWPGITSCNGFKYTYYQYCGNTTPQNWEDYPELSLKETTRKDLRIVMPASGFGYLHRHEYFKHGTCQTQWNQDQYYVESMRLTREFNSSSFAEHIRNNIGKSVHKTKLEALLDTEFGEGAHNKVKLQCSKKKDLIDVYIQLPAVVESNTTLSSLLQQQVNGISNPKYECSETFTIDEIGER